ncbi:MAG TPA: leucine-rich repeat domain-containing protein [Candidatus Caccomonas pullistercoris]|nr:leucine-rich repeat domain-containing protein [Candidatus Caccomonas pullistercoris]
MKKHYFMTLCLALLGLRAEAYDFSAVSEGQFPIDLYYAVNPDGTTVTLVQGPTTYECTALEIPATVTHEGKTYTVTTIGAQAFRLADIGRFTLPATVTTIQDAAFQGCDGTPESFPTSLKFIGDNAFEGAHVVEAVLPEGLEHLGTRAFSASYNNINPNTLSRVVLPSTLTEMGDYAFEYQRSLTDLTLPENMTEIPDYTFQECGGLTTVSLPDALQRIGYRAFMNTGLTSVTFPASLTEIAGVAFSNTSLTEVTLPDGVKTLGESAFASCGQLQRITFSSGLTELPRSVCSYCSQLTEVNIPEGVRSIGTSAFDHCARLTTITLPESMTTLGDFAFIQSGLTKFAFPSNLTEMGSGVFDGCRDLTEITLPASLTTLSRQTFSGCTALTTVHLSEELTEIDDHAFDGCTALAHLDIPVGVTKIGGSVFVDCTALTSIDLPHTLTSIGDYAFNRSGLTAIDVPQSVTELGGGLVRDCEDITAFRIRNAIPPRIIGSGDAIINATVGPNCTLYVPEGSKADYEATKQWANFGAIVEEEADPNTLYRVTARSTGFGTVRLTAGDAEGTTLDVRRGAEVTLSLKPATGYALTQLLRGETDVTADVENNTYVIPSVEANAAFVATFGRVPVTLSLSSGAGGTMDVTVPYGETFTLALTPADGWTLNAAYLDGLDVTADVAEGGLYTTPELMRDAALAVSFEKTVGIENAGVVSQARAYADRSGRLVVEGLGSTERADVLTASGQRLATLTADSGRVTWQLPAPGTYVVRVPGKGIKVGY